MPPSRAYLLALDQPDINAPSMPTALAASTNSTPAPTSAATTVGERGMTASATRYGTRATAGASLNTQRSAASGTMSSFWTNLAPSATSCAQPWNPPAYIGPNRPCMCAITLCSIWPTTSGSTRNAPSTITDRSTTSSAAFMNAALEVV